MKYFLLNTEAHNLKRNSKQLLQKKTAWKVKFKIKRGKPICVRVIASDCQLLLLLLLLLFIALAFFTNLLFEFLGKFSTIKNLHQAASNVNKKDIALTSEWSFSKTFFTKYYICQILRGRPIYVFNEIFKVVMRFNFFYS